MSNRITLAQLAKMDARGLEAFPLDHLEVLLEELSDMKAKAASLDAKLYGELHRRFAAPAAAGRQKEGKDTGTIRLDEGGIVVVADLPKKVEWDQSKLAAIVDTIGGWDGESVSDYVEIKYSVAERKYAAWPTSIRKLFDAARTVATGKPTYKIVRPGADKAAA